MKIRQIKNPDLRAVRDLLCEGFPRQSARYWDNALMVLAGRQKYEDIPTFGLTLEVDGALQGVILMITGNRNGKLLCNLSSWYVRPRYRKFSPLLFQRALRSTDASFTDCSPADHILPIATKFGFIPYTDGTLMVDARACVRPSGLVDVLDEQTVEQINPKLQETIAAHLSYGCRGFMLMEHDPFPIPVLYRTTLLKKVLPAARFVYGSPDLINRYAGGLARKFLAGGVPIMLMDLPPHTENWSGRALHNYGRRYAKGPTPPAVGDLLDTEISLFGL